MTTDAGGEGGAVAAGAAGTGGLDCPASVSGTVFDPGGQLPLADVLVYVPSAPLEELPEGAVCQSCDGMIADAPLTATFTDATGNFTLELDDVPVRDNLPLVVQVGKWRRELTLSDVNTCGHTAIPPATVRLPRDRSEGSLPRIAAVRGGSDALECVLRKLGISDSEFTTDAEDGRVHLYASDAGSADPGTTQLADGTPIPLAGTLYGSLEKLMTYDLLVLGCDGGGSAPFADYGQAAFSNVHTYADQGGRIFGSHFQSYWVRPDALDFEPPYPQVATFSSTPHEVEDGTAADIDDSFPKGTSLRDWLSHVGASPTPGKLALSGGEHTVDAVVAGVSQAWLTVASDQEGHQGVVSAFSFDTPVGGAACGRMTFADVHVVSGTNASGDEPFPTGCVDGELSPQEKAFAFMLFDLSACTLGSVLGP